jgi:hypothetical protein
MPVDDYHTQKPPRVIVTEFVIDPQSVEYLRGRLADGQTIARLGSIRSPQ